MDIPFSSAIDGFILTCNARSLSPNTIADYSSTARKFTRFLGGDPLIRSIGTREIETFLTEQPVSKKSKLNYYIGLSALWTWALAEQLVDSHKVRALQPPRPEVRQIVPFSEAEIKAIVQATSGTYAISLRLRAIVLLLLDTGVRASELCSIKISDLHIKEGYIIVYGKGDKERRVEFGPRTGQAVWKYLTTRGKPEPHESLFISRTGRTLDREDLAKILKNLGKRAGVTGVHPHRFRHTFAVMFLRNGGSSLALQRLLGHSTMEMVRVYVHLSEVDLQQAHRRASPVENMRL